MQDLNSVFLIGRITKDVADRDFGYTQGRIAKLNTSIAVNLSVKKGKDWKDEASFFNITLWGKTAENLKPYITKGQQVAIQGHLQQQRWEDGNYSQKSIVAIIPESVQLLGSKNKQEVAPITQEVTTNESFPEDIPF